MAKSAGTDIYYILYNSKITRPEPVDFIYEPHSDNNEMDAM